MQSVIGRGSRTRTHDTWFWRPMFYQLNYTPKILYYDNKNFIICKVFLFFNYILFKFLTTLSVNLLMFSYYKYKGVFYEKFLF